MTAGDVVVCWILPLPAVAAFFLAYGVVEEIIRKQRQSRKTPEATPRNFSVPPIEKAPEADPAPAAHGYGTPELFRHDVLLHIGQLKRAAAKHERNIQALLAEIKKKARVAGAKDGRWEGAEN